MRFGDVLREIAARMEAGGQSFALIGGLGLSSYGISRATLDLDLLVPAEVQDFLVPFMEELGYETLHRSRGYSNHLHADPERGRVDFVYVQRETREQLFAAAKEVDGPGGVRVLVPRVEHMVAMKVLAMKNDPERRPQDMVDVAALLKVPGVDRDEVRGYFEQHGLLELWREL